jgi:stage II sporulation protein D
MSFKCRAYGTAILLTGLSIMLTCAHSGHFFINHVLSQKLNTIRVKVLLFTTREPISLASDNEITISGLDQHGGTNDILTKSMTIRPDAVTSPTRVASKNSFIEVNGYKFRGAIELFIKNNLLYVINDVGLEEYLMSVVPGEIPANWEEEALKAQAVAARTYIYHHLVNNRGRVEGLYDVDAGTKSQVYKGADVEKPETTESVDKTAGEIIVHKNLPIMSCFHSTCGGKTIDGKYVWSQNDLEYLRGVRCDFCTDSAKYAWESQLTIKEIGMFLKKKHGQIGTIAGISFKKKDSRVTDVYIRHTFGQIKMSGNNFRLLFPDDKLRSLFFTSQKTPSGLILTGRGWGHGVGMCQWGARGMAKKGYSYKSILAHYYTDVAVDRIQINHVASDFKPR